MRFTATPAVPVLAALLVAAAPAWADDSPQAAPALKKVDAAPGAGIDPKAKAIHDRGMEAVKKLDGIEMTSRLSVEGVDPSMIPPGVTDPAFLVVDFSKPAAGPMPFPRFAMDCSKDGKPAGRFVFDGSKAIATDESSKTYVEAGDEWLMVLGQRAAALPGWYLENRMFGDRQQGEGVPQLVEMTVVGEETVDGKACDVVRCVRSMKVDAMDEESGTTPAGAQELRMTETIAFAREDGLPRRVASRTEGSGGDDAGMGKVTATHTFTGVKANPERPDAKFATAAPEGYKKSQPAASEEPTAPELKVKAGDAAPAFSLTDLGGKQVSLDSLKGQVVLLDFWATWCGPCKAAMPSIQKIHDDYKGKGVAVLGVNTWENKEDAAKQYVEKKGYTYPCLLKGDDLAKAYGMSGIPTLVVIGKDGKIVEIEVGMAPGGDGKLRKAIDEALAAK